MLDWLRNDVEDVRVREEKSDLFLESHLFVNDFPILLKS